MSNVIILRELPPIEVPKIVLAGDHRKPCCQQSENLEYYQINHTNKVFRCKKCGCRHFEIDAEPGRMGFY